MASSNMAGVFIIFFLGVLSSSEDSTELLTEYTKHGADAVMTDVNDILEILSSQEGSD